MNKDINVIQDKKKIDYSYSSLNYPKYFGGLGGHIAAVYEFYNPYSDTYYIGSTMNFNDRMNKHKSGLRNGRAHSKRFIQDYQSIVNRGEEPENVIQCKLLYSKVMLEMPDENQWFEIINYIRTYESNAIQEAFSKGKKLYNVIRNVPTFKAPKVSTGNVPSNAIPVLCDNEPYTSQSKAANTLGVSKDEIKRRLKSDKFPGYKIITPEKYTELTGISFLKAPNAYNATKPLKGVYKGEKRTFKSIYEAKRITGLDREIIRNKLNCSNNQDWEYL